MKPLTVITNARSNKMGRERLYFNAAHELLKCADKLLTMGYPIGNLETGIRKTMAAVPVDLRDELPLPPAVMAALCADVFDALERNEAPVWAHDGSDFWDASDLEDVEPIAQSRFWYSVACGELRPGLHLVDTASPP